MAADPSSSTPAPPSTATKYLEDLFVVVEPDDVRSVFISHDDVDHYGNLHEVMAEVPECHAGRQLVLLRAEW